MLGAIAGDIIGSVYERDNTKTKNFLLFRAESRFTDDTVLTVAIADAILNRSDYTDSLKRYHQRFPHVGYGGTFNAWAGSSSREPYNSWGNGSAMRVSPVAYAFEDLAAVLQEAQRTAAVTHNHPEGIKGAQAVAAAIFWARTGCSKAEIKTSVESTFGYDLSKSLDEIRPTYRFDVSCQGSVPQAITAFLEATDFEDAIRNAVSIGGDSDTIACIAGSIAEAFYQGVPEPIKDEIIIRLDQRLYDVVEAFQAQYGV
ncbi:ADP-ribosylglycohydrolase family protein [Kovacikia minuta CCNUW1]|uniref:ADP-ribosylglycohydrolase family protein n=1 Tax=Kovacikia minuta TaxID=2931930 RepID=UPI001CD03B68|nr:ADP-ribosylglycohydrolase family protein [Kovacikia minuta]UBF26616.1 ADP-ribosylglycohydrolase family protein [Kovacikia minuta CCNUW1]